MDMPLDAAADLPDEVLLARYAEGDPAAARALTARLTPAVFAVACRLLGSRADAEDVTQEAMLRLWKIAPEWRVGEARVSTWLYRVASNLCTDRLRRRREAPLDPEFDPPDDAVGAEGRLQAQSREAALQAALDTLPESQRKAVVLRHIEGLSNPEIGDILGLSVEAVESLTARGKRALARILATQRESLGFSDE